MFRVVRPLLILSLIALGSFAFAGVAGAHSDTGEMEILKLQAKGNNRVLVEVGVVYGNDGHIAEDAEVRAQLDGPGGPYVASLQRVGDGSRFQGIVNVKGPGKYKVTVTSTSPNAQATGEVRVKEQEQEEPDPTATDSGAAEPADTTPTVTDAPVEAAEETVAGDAGGDNSDGDGGIPGVWIAVLGFLVVIGGIIGFWISQRRRGGGNNA